MNMLRAAALALAFGLAAAAPAQSFTPISQSEVYEAESAMMSAASRAAAIRRLKHVPSVGVIDLRIRTVPRFSDDAVDVSEFRIFAGKYASGIAKLRAALKANPATRKALQSRGIPINRVVGVRIGSSGALRLYIL